MKTHRIATLCCTLVMSICLTQSAAATRLPSRLNITRTQLMDKIKGGWAGQTIGVTYGFPTEFVYRGRIIDDSIAIPWPEGYVLNTMRRSPGLYDDIYMDLTFVEVFERLGIDAPTDSIAMAFASAPYNLWHANQAARYNIQHGLTPPMTGHWLNNPHADDIDYQIEADYAGLMSPGMPNSASAISDRVGHIMNYGDGWYGGVFVGAMYSIAFLTDDIPTIVTQALKCIPARSKFHRCIAEVVEFWRRNPDDWKAAWQMCFERWNDDKGCGEGVLMPLNIDAVINSAYVVIGLLYGQGDMGRTMDIATRCGQDSDCNPSSAAGILGTAMGYSAIPDRWLSQIKEAEEVDFAYTHTSLSRAYQLSMEHATEMIRRGGGTVDGEQITIRCQRPRPVRYEQSFAGIEVAERRTIKGELSAGDVTFDAPCAGITVCGAVRSADKSYVARIEVSIDGQVAQIVEMPARYHDRRLDIFWDYTLPQGGHSFRLRWLNPAPEVKVEVPDAIIYSASSKRK